MTLIAHGILKANEAVKRKKYEKITSKSKSEHLTKIDSKTKKEISDLLEYGNEILKHFERDIKNETKVQLDFDPTGRGLEYRSIKHLVKLIKALLTEYSENGLAKDVRKQRQESALDDIYKYTDEKELEYDVYKGPIFFDISFKKRFLHLFYPLYKEKAIASAKLNKAEKKLNKLKKFEEKIVIGDRFPSGPWALELAAAEIFVITPTAALVSCGLALGVVGKGLIEEINSAKAKRYWKKIEEQKIEAQKRKEKELEQERFVKTLAANAQLRSEEKATERETEVFKDIIKNADTIIRRGATKNDLNVFHAGLLNPEILTDDNIIQIDNEHVAFVYDFGNKKEMNVFFVNPETKNYEHVSQIKSERGIKDINFAIAQRVSELETEKIKTNNIRNKNTILKAKLAKQEEK